MLVSIYDYDFTLNDKLGSVEISLKDLFYDKTRAWVAKVYPILDEKSFPGAGEIELQFQYRPADEKVGDDTPAPAAIFTKQADEEATKKAAAAKKQAEEDAEPFVKGKLFIAVIAARNLLNLDTFGASDPFV